MAQVWDSDLSRPEKLVALAYADICNDDGIGIYISVGHMAWKCSYDDRSVQAVTRKLEQRGVLSYLGKHEKYQTNCYRFNVAALPKRADWKSQNTGRPQKGGENFAPQTEKGVKILQKGGEEIEGESISNNHKYIPKNGQEEHLPPGGAGSSFPDNGSLLDGVLDNGKGRRKEVPPAVSVYYAEARPQGKRWQISSAWQMEVVQAVGESTDAVNRWRRLVRNWIGRGWNPTNVKGMLESYSKGDIELQAGKTQPSATLTLPKIRA